MAASDSPRSGPTDGADRAEGFDDRVDVRLKRGNDNSKWRRYGEGVTPAWVAEHDFRPPAAVVSAMQATLDRGDFGYHDLDAEVAEAFVLWARQRYGWRPRRELVHTSVDALAAVTAAVTALSEPGEGVVLTPPIYHVFLKICPSARRLQVDWPMRRDPLRGWHLDPEDLAALLRTRDDCRVLLWCNPHNPTGWVPPRPVLERLVQLAHEHDFHIVSDEIHGDLVFADAPAAFTPMLAVDGASERVVTVTSPAKTFALSGLRCAVTAYGDESLLTRVRRAHPPLLLGHAARTGIDAATAAWRYGHAWADGLVEHLAEMRGHLAARLSAEVPEVRMHPPESTFLAWLDLTACELGPEPAAALLRRAGLAVSEGADFGPGGEGHVRVNFGTSKPILDDIIDRLVSGIRT